MSRSAALTHELDRFFRDVAPLEPGRGLVVAFSGGPDSTTLLWGLTRLRERRDIPLVAAHLDHGLDADSERRAERARALAAELDVAFTHCRSDPRSTRRSHGVEDWARGERYTFLEQQRQLHRADYIATAHHRDDQVETVLLRLQLGSGLEGLAGMPVRRQHIVRPLLALPRRKLAEYLAASGLQPIDDPSNRNLAHPRNLLRHHIAPWLETEEPNLRRKTLLLSHAARRAVAVIARRLERQLGPRREHRGASLDLERFRALHAALHPFALSTLHRLAGLPYPASKSARKELQRQLERGQGIGCDCGNAWRWQAGAGRLHLVPQETSAQGFTYTLRAPGELEVPEIGIRLYLDRASVAPWMFEGRPTRAALDLPLRAGDHVTVRSRRPGDRIRPLGCRYARRLKEVLIDRRVPRADRDRLPLLCLGDRIAWVPGVTIDEEYRIGSDSRPWVARIEPI